MVVRKKIKKKRDKMKIIMYTPNYEFKKSYRGDNRSRYPS